MNNISDIVISAEEARTALRCMSSCGLSAEEALETIDEFALRIRKITSSYIVDDIIDNQLSETQRNFMKEYWFQCKSAGQIADKHNVSAANVYKTLARASEAVRRLMTPLIKYQNDLDQTDIVPLYTGELMQISSARNGNHTSFASQLRALRLKYAIAPEKLASSLKISIRELEEIESGEKLPSVISAMRYSAIFNAQINMNFKNGGGTFECQEVLKN